ncbi:MAG: hypothetical protein ACLFQV_13840 [Vulcanimicrobiota bacterium]
MWFFNIFQNIRIWFAKIMIYSECEILINKIDSHIMKYMNEFNLRISQLFSRNSNFVSTPAFIVVALSAILLVIYESVKYYKIHHHSV